MESIFEEAVLFPSIQKHGMGFMSWGTLDKGILTGRVHHERKFDDVDVRSHAPWWTSVDHTPRYKAMETITPLIQEAGHTGLELALSHDLAHPEASSGRKPWLSNSATRKGGTP